MARNSTGNGKASAFRPEPGDLVLLATEEQVFLVDARHWRHCGRGRVEFILAHPAFWRPHSRGNEGASLAALLSFSRCSLAMG